MKKKNLATRLSLKKIKIASLVINEAASINGGNIKTNKTCPGLYPTVEQGCPPETCQDGGASFCIGYPVTHVCIPATEPQGCSNGCPITGVN